MAQKIRSKVTMNHDASTAFHVNFYSTCGGSVLTKTNTCDGLEKGQVVDFEVDISVSKCPANQSEWRQTFKVYPVGLDESMIIEVEMLCECECEKSAYEAAPECNGNGAFRCGICNCDDNHSGNKCVCNV